MKIDRRNPAHWLLLLQQCIYTLIAIPVRAVRGGLPRPLVVLYGHQLSGNLKAIYEEWEKNNRCGIDMAYLSLDPEYAALLRAEGRRVLQCNRLRDMLRVGRASAMITDHGLHLMKPLLGATDIRFIDVWHGIPFKGFTPDDFRLQHRYDEVWVTSPLLKSMYVERFGFSADRVLCLGYARTDRLFQRPTPSSSFRRSAGLPPDRRVVLYAPTWRQDHAGRELFPFGEDQDAFLDLLGNACNEHDATLVIRAHLNASISSRLRDNAIYCSQRDFPDTEDVLLGSDVLICDWSSIAFDFLALDRPTLFLDVHPPFKNGFSLGPEYRFGCIVQDTVSLDRELRAILTEPDYYLRRFGNRHCDITAKLYQADKGASASRQLEHLERMINSRQAQEAN